MRKHPFTLLELLASMAVLTIFMLALMRFFAVSQDALSLSADRASQYERARIAMDLIANDLRNIYYVEGLNTVCYNQEDSNGVTNKLSIAVNRQSKIGDAVTTLTRVTYKFEKANYKLLVAAIGDKDENGYWNIGANSAEPDTVFKTVPDSIMCELLDGVYSFRLIPRNASFNPESMSFNAGGRRIPDVVTIEITLIDQGTMDKIKAFKDQGLSASVDDSQLRVFTRNVEIDRGQY